MFLSVVPDNALAYKGWVLSVYLELRVAVFQQTFQDLLLGFVVELIRLKAAELQNLRGIHVAFVDLVVSDLLVPGLVHISGDSSPQAKFLAPPSALYLAIRLFFFLSESHLL